jgi:uncharacterized protein
VRQRVNGKENIQYIFLWTLKRREFMAGDDRLLFDNPMALQVTTQSENSVVDFAMPVARQTAIAPVEKGERLSSIDALRGFALLGILVMNIVAFGLPDQAYMYPIVAGGSTGWNFVTWFLVFTLWEGKMRAIFSLMFGASVYLLVDRLSRRGAGMEAADIHFRRMLWLLLFGFVHAYFIWEGDILFFYAICGLFLYPLRKLSPKVLLISAGLLFLSISGYELVKYVQVRHLQSDYLKLGADERAGKKLTKEQEATKKKWTSTVEKIFPPNEELQKGYEAHRGGYWKLLKYRAEGVFHFHGKPVYFPPFYFDFLGMMLIGMALIKMNVLSGGCSRRFYGWMALIGFVIGIPCHAATAWLVARESFSITAQHFAGVIYEFGRFAVFGYCGALLLLFKAGLWRGLTSRLAAVGQMAFSNYILTSILCTLLFEGYGFGLYGRLERWQLYLVLPGVWLIQLIISPIWLRHFRFGPLEWGWRSLTYWKVQPMRIDSVSLL